MTNVEPFDAVVFCVMSGLLLLIVGHGVWTLVQWVRLRCEDRADFGTERGIR